MDWNRFTSISCSTLEKLRDDRARLLVALKFLMEQPTMSPLAMTPEQRYELWEAHRRAREAIAKAEEA